MNHVLKTSIDNTPCLFNTITQDIHYLPSNLLDRAQSISKRLFGLNNCLQLEIIPTWKCNFRCPHCYVKDHLIPSGFEEKGININLVTKFISDFIDYNPTIKYIRVNLLGGESFLEPNKCTEIIIAIKKICLLNNIKAIFSSSTNLSFDLTKHHLEYIEQLDSILVSLDGLEQTNNNQRFSLSSENTNPFLKTLLNIKQCVELVSVTVQAVLSDKDYDNKQLIADYIYILSELDVAEDQIQIGCKVPVNRDFTNNQNIIKYFKNNKTLYPSPCCCFRYMCHLVIGPENNLYIDYHNIDETLVCSLEEYDFSNIEKQYKQSILERMDVLNDPGCSSCPVIGLCWGRCVTLKCFTNGKPSLFCNKEQLIETVNIMAKQGTLIEKVLSYQNLQKEIEYLKK